MNAEHGIPSSVGKMFVGDYLLCEIFRTLVVDK